MKYIAIMLVAVTACLVVGFGLALLLERILSRRWSAVQRVALSALLGILAFAGVTALYLGRYYHASQRAIDALGGSPTVRVTQTGDGSLFDGPGASTLLVFLPGAKVESSAYAPLMSSLADGGIDCFLVDPPANVAFLAGGAIDRTLGGYRYDHLILAGHSLGGVMASSYASSHPQQVDGLALLASYTTKELDDSVRVCTIYGSDDGVFDLAAYKDSLVLLPPNSQEVCIPGGNHANFGDYGSQDGDQPGTIGREEQQDIAKSAILDLAQAIAEADAA